MRNVCLQAKVTQKRVAEKKAKPQINTLNDEEEEESSEQDEEEEEEEGSSGSSSSEEEEDQEAVVGLKRKKGETQGTIVKKSKVTEEQSESHDSHMMCVCITLASSVAVCEGSGLNHSSGRGLLNKAVQV